MMDPDGIASLLFNLKMQFLALPALLRWGAMTGASIYLLREAITLGWDRWHRTALPTGADVNALPVPDPFAKPSVAADTREQVGMDSGSSHRRE